MNVEERQQEAEKAREEIKRLITAGELPKARAMTRGERRQLNEAGLNINVKNEVMNFSEQHEKMCDWIIDNLYSGFDFDTLPNNISATFATYVYQLTYEDKIAEKN